MAGNPYDSTDPQTIKLWAKDTWRNARQADAIFDPKNKLVGQGESAYTKSPIVMIDDFEGGPGDEVTISNLMDSDGRGTIDNEQVVGTETMHDHNTFKFACRVQRFGHKATGIFVNAQRVPYKYKEECQSILVDRFMKRRAVGAINHLCGNSRQTDIAYAGMNAVSDYDANHIYRCGYGLGASNDQTVGGNTSALFDVNILDELIMYAETGSPPLRPWMIEGNPYYVMLIHPAVEVQLKKTSSTWYAEMRDALKGGMIKDNPIFSRALGMHGNCLIIREPYLTQGRNSSTSAAVANTRRNVFLGAGALAMGYGVISKEGDKDRLVWHNEIQDAGSKYNVYCTWNWGMKRLEFKDATAALQAYGSIAVTSYAPDPPAYKIATGPTGSYISTFDLGQPQP